MSFLFRSVLTVLLVSQVTCANLDTGSIIADTGKPCNCQFTEDDDLELEEENTGIDNSIYVTERNIDEDCYSGKDSKMRDYRGKVHTTKSGLECQAWDSQSPHRHSRTPKNYPDAGLDKNYCRNPDGEKHAWCYTTSKKTRWELCDIRPCQGNIIEGVKYPIGKTLKPGDYIEVSWPGIDKEFKHWYGIELLNYQGDVILRVELEGSRERITFRSKIGGKRSHKVYAKRYNQRFDKPEIEQKLTIVCEDGYFKMLFNGVDVSDQFTYVKSLSDVTSYSLFGLSKIKCNGVTISKDKKHPYYIARQSLATTMKQLRDKLSKDLHDKTINKISAYLNSNEGSLALLKWRLMKNIYDRGEVMKFTPQSQWILNNREALETFMLSEGTSNYGQALNVLATIIRNDPGAKSGLKLKIAAATALVLPFGRNAFSYWNYTRIDQFERYNNYVKWMNEGVLFDQFYKLSAWQLKFVVDCSNTDAELVWARANILPKYKSESMVGYSYRMVSYRSRNADGISVQTGAPYYYYKPRTLENYVKIGAVCGGISQFTGSMCKAFGIPAEPIGQPGHCAYVWMKNGQFKLGYDVSGWEKSKCHKETWGSKNPSYYLLMNTCQSKTDVYWLSEKMRLATPFINPGLMFPLLVKAVDTCPQNYGAWMEMKEALNVKSLKRSDVRSSLKPMRDACLEKDVGKCDTTKEVLAWRVKQVMGSYSSILPMKTMLKEIDGYKD